jgi:hypothetical protein
VVDGAPRETLRLEAALKMVQPGQTVRLLSGVYTEPVEIANKGGSFDRPIVIRGESGVTFDDRRNLERPTDGESVDRRGYAFIKILDSQGIILGKRRTIDLPNGGHWTIPDQLNLGAIGEKESPHKLDKLGWRESDGKPGPSWATPKPGSLAFPPEEDFVPVP